MTREDLETFILETYNAATDHPWARYPDCEVFRHPANKKWFALLMDVPPSVLSKSSQGVESACMAESRIAVLNVKVNPILSGSLRSEPGIHPAYHMNKDKWLTLELDVVSEETVKLLLEMSFDATKPKKPGEKRTAQPVEKKPRRPYPQRLFSDLLDVDKSDVDKTEIEGKEPQDASIAEKLRNRVGNTNELDADLADLLISLIKEPYQDMVRKYYKDEMSYAAIGRTHGVSGTRVSQRVDKGLKLIRRAWIQNGVPSSMAEYHAFIRAKEAAITRDTEIGALGFCPRIYGTLTRYGIHTVDDLLKLTGEKKIPNIGVTSWNEINAMRMKLSAYPQIAASEPRPVTVTHYRYPGVPLTLDSPVDCFEMTVRVHDAFTWKRVYTVAHLLALTGAERLHMQDPVAGWGEIRQLQAEARELLESTPERESR